MKLKENAATATGPYAKLNAETYGGGIWYSFFDRPLKIAGRVVVKDGDTLKSENVVSEYTVTIPSLAVHMNRGVNEGFSVNPQTDLLIRLMPTQLFIDYAQIIGIVWAALMGILLIIATVKLRNQQ